MNISLTRRNYRRHSIHRLRSQVRMAFGSLLRTADGSNSCSRANSVTTHFRARVSHCHSTVGTSFRSSETRLLSADVRTNVFQCKTKQKCLQTAVPATKLNKRGNVHTYNATSRHFHIPNSAVEKQ